MNSAKTLDRCAVERIVGRSAWVRRIRREIVRIAAHPTSVLVTGPTGTGKELIARAIHAHSPRAAEPFIPVDCASIQGALFTSQLFGHVKGAFTGAAYASLGCFRAADGGTLFLDEIGELQPELQAKLLRVLQERTVVPVGSHDGVPVDVRLITATNRDLSAEVAAGRFRSDLYYRLKVASLKAMPLKDRRDDIETLADHFLDKLSFEAGLPLKALSPEAMAMLTAYDWPGNVRELQNLLECAAISTDRSVIDGQLLSSLTAIAPLADTTVDGGGPVQDIPVQPPPPQHALGQVSFNTAADEEIVDGDTHVLTRPTLAEVEREYIHEILKEANYNQTICARVLNIDRRQLVRKVKKHGIPVPAPRRGRPSR